LYDFKNPNAKKIILEHLSKQRISDKNAEAIVDIVLKDKNVEKFRNQIKRLAEDSCSKIDRLKNEKLKLQLATLARSIIEDL
jgi:geranylgeranyl pyrophosphate synthase